MSLDTANTGGGIRYPFETPPAKGEAIKVAEGILWMRLPLPMKLDHVNVYALDDGAGWTLVDTGFDTAELRAIWRELLDGPLAGKPVKRVIVSHHHPDHIGLAGWFQTEFGAELVTTQTAWITTRMLTLDVQPRPVPETLRFWQEAGMDAETFAKKSAERPFNFSDVVAPLPLGYTRIHEGSRIFAGGRNWTVHIGEGHAPEHACLFSDDDHIVLGGDQLLPSISPNIGVYPTEPMADPLDGWLKACAHMETFAREDQLVLGGHKLPFTGLPTRLDQFAKNHHGALDRLLEHLREPKTTVECFVTLFKRPIGEAEYGLALAEAVAHVNHLFLNGKITRTLEDDGAWRWRTVG